MTTETWCGCSKCGNDFLLREMYSIGFDGEYACFDCFKGMEGGEEALKMLLELAPKGVNKGGEKFDHGKLDFSIVPFECLDELAKIMTYGCIKYGKPSGWQLVENMEDRYFSALMRHLSAYKQGEARDPESNELHLSHALCNIVFLLWKELQKEKQ